jgi:hypothetical protein
LSARRIYQDLVEQNDFRDGACSKALKAGTYRSKAGNPLGHLQRSSILQEIRDSGSPKLWDLPDAQG